MVDSSTVGVEEIREYEWRMKVGVASGTRYDKKGLAKFAVNTGFRCGHQCIYCFGPQTNQFHPVWKTYGLEKYDQGYCIVDPGTPDRLFQKKVKVPADSVITVGTYSDAWAPEARKRGLGRAVIRKLLDETPATIRMITKSAEIARDFDIMLEAPERFMVGLSVGIPAARQDVASVLEPRASTVADRLDALREAHRLGLRTFGMICPCVPGVSDSIEALAETVGELKACGAEPIWAEPLNDRGGSNRRVINALRAAGLSNEADAVATDTASVQRRWSYAIRLSSNLGKAASRLGVDDRLRFMVHKDSLPEKGSEMMLMVFRGEVLVL